MPSEFEVPNNVVCDWYNPVAMQELNWNAFRLKFNGRESKAFETLCYRLFCREFGRNLGIFRYKNQTGIETEPVLVNDELIGFQSKFFDHTINKQETTKSIEKAKLKNPDLKKIHVYLNLEFSESTKPEVKEAATKAAIEQFARSVGLQIEWRVPSHIEAQLSLDENKTLAQYFFSLEKGIADSVEELTEHSSAILKPIHSKIEFGGSEIRIDRTQTLKELSETLAKSSLAIVSGVAGVGKTALIKDFVEIERDDAPLFIFKAIEFNIAHINELFKNYGHFSLVDFITEHEPAKEKYVVIDSAEKLSDLENQEAFREFLSTLIGSNWKIIFTTRYSYLEDLKFQFVNVYRVPFEVLLLKNLEPAALQTLSKQYGFSLPLNDRLLELLENPFYLNEYLRAYGTLGETTTFSEFKNLLWNKQIAKSSKGLKREACFIALAKRRADTGRFFVTDLGDCDENTLKDLAADEIIEHDPTTGGFFITHGIYEEWALDKFVDRSFYNSDGYPQFFNLLGASLPTRRAFRNWLSERLLTNREEVRPLIETSFTNQEIQPYWKDEILISVLLSDYSQAFFQMFEKVLLEDDQRILMRVIFLLRIACKEIDNDLLQALRMNAGDVASLTAIFTRPRGAGWNCAINFLFRHREQVNTSHIDIILPLLEHWNDKIRSGSTTRSVGLLALYYYQEADKQHGMQYRAIDERKKELTAIVLNATSELKEELTLIFESVLAKKDKDYRGQYYEMIQIALSSATTSFEIAKNLPEQLIKLANLFWFEDPKEEFDDEHRHSMMIGVEPHFCISSRHNEYFPSSAFQTPIFQLLKFAPRATIDFIISFTNRTIQCYSQSELKNEAQEVTVWARNNTSTQQWISSRLWNTYRGNKVSTCLLESMHMALEKWLVEYVKRAAQPQAETVCADILKNSKSASLTAVIVSAVLTQPSKLFDIASLLFQTKEFFIFESERWALDQKIRSNYSFLSGHDSRHKIYEDERMRTCEEPHRKLSLERLAFNYQFFKSEDVDDETFKHRQGIIWAIFDKHYEALPAPKGQTESDKTWRMYLARMDRRKLSPEVEERNGQVLVQFTPQIDSELKQFSDDAVQESSEALKYIPLQLWSNLRFRGEKDGYAEYQQYESNPQLAWTETKQIVDAMGAGAVPVFSRHVPAYTCAVLLRDFADKLSSDEKTFCKEVTLEFAAIPVQFERYSYQTIDGTEPAITSLSRLMNLFPADKEVIKTLLLLHLLSPFNEISAFATRSILKDLWNNSLADAQSLFLGFLTLRPRVSEVTKQLMDEKFAGKVVDFWGVPAKEIFQRMLTNYDAEFESIISNEITNQQLPPVEPLSLRGLTRAFELLPLGTTDASHKNFVNKIMPIFAQRIFNDRDEKLDYMLNHSFFDKLAYFVLMSGKSDIPGYLQPLIDHFRVSRDGDNLFARFVSAEDALDRYDEFWTVWEIFYETISQICKRHPGNYDVQSIMHNYLLAWQFWPENATEWHGLRDREKLFFQRVARDLGHHPSVLYSIAKLLNDIGSRFLNDGIIWISEIVTRNPNLRSDELEINTLYYLEKAIRKYVLLNRRLLKTSIQARTRLVQILDFLVDRGSVTGYLVREDVL